MKKRCTEDFVCVEFLFTVDLQEVFNSVRSGYFF